MTECLGEVYARAFTVVRIYLGPQMKKSRIEILDNDKSLKKEMSYYYNDNDYYDYYYYGYDDYDDLPDGYYEHKVYINRIKKRRGCYYYDDMLLGLSINIESVYSIEQIRNKKIEKLFGDCLTRPSVWDFLKK